MGMLFFLLNTHSIKAYFILKCNGLEKIENFKVMEWMSPEPGKSRKIRVLIEEAKQRFRRWKRAFEAVGSAAAIRPETAPA